MTSHLGIESAHVSKGEASGVNEPAPLEWNEIVGSEELVGNLNDKLRLKINASSTAKSENNLTQSVSAFVEQVLSDAPLNKMILAPVLNNLYQQQFKLYTETNIPKPLRTRQYICGSGLILSPDHCVSTIQDSLRVGLFLRGVDKALRQLTNKKMTAPLHIVYPACGPFAPLLLPLLAYYKNNQLYSSAEINVTFIDIQEGAVLALESLINKLGLQEYVRDIHCIDACEYHTQNDVHLVILEAMQHGFSREGHLRLAKHYAALLDDKGIFLPKQILVTASLNVAQCEYLDQWGVDDPEQRKKMREKRKELGEVLRVDLDFLRSMQEKTLDEYTDLLECATLVIPPLKDHSDEQTLLFHTRINVFDDDWLGEYESGITHPLPDSQVCVNFIPRDARPGDLLVNSGDSLTFYYCLNGLPGFLTTKSSVLSPTDEVNSLVEMNNDASN